MARRQLQQLKPRTRALFEQLIARNEETGGRWARTRTWLALARLTPSMWDQYTTALRPFTEFLLAEHLELTEVTEAGLEHWVCWLVESDRYHLKGGTVAQYLAGARTCLGGLHVQLGDTHGTRGALSGYKKLDELTRPPVHRRPAWSAEHTTEAVRAARFLLPALQRGELPGAERRFVTATLHVVVAALTFSRGDSTNPMRCDELEPGPDGFHVRLSKQKRPKRHPPPQHSFRATAHPDCPIAFARDVARTLRYAGYAADALLFGTTSSASAPLTLDASVQLLVQHLQLDFGARDTPPGHSVRIGAVSEAYGIGVPMPTIAHMCTHKTLQTTQGYIRHGIPVSPSAHLYYAHLHPTATGGSHPLCSVYDWGTRRVGAVDPQASASH